MLNIAHCYRLGFAIGKVTRTNKSSSAIVPTLRRGNTAVDAPASRNAGALRTEFPRRSVTAIKLRLDSPFSLREKVRMRGSNKAFFLIFILLGNRSLRCSTSCIRAVVTPTLSAIAPALPYLLHLCKSSSRRGSFFLNLMAVTPERGSYSGRWGIYCESPKKGGDR